MQERELDQARLRQEKEEFEALLETVPLSTLHTCELPFEEIGIIWGDVGGDEEDALRELRIKALATGCDAVIGVSFCFVTGSSTAIGGQTRVSSQPMAYGTGIRWELDDDDSEDDVPEDDVPEDFRSA